MTYTLKTWKTGSHTRDGYILDYSVACPDGLVLHFHNDGHGGGDFCTHGKRGRTMVPHQEAMDAERKLAEWCQDQPAVIEEEKRYGGGADSGTRLLATTDMTTAIWAASIGEELDFQKTIQRTAKRTVCYHLPGSKDLRYFTIRRGRKLTDEDRERLAHKVLSKHPDAIVYGAVVTGDRKG